MHKLSLTHPETLVIRKHILKMNQTKPTSRHGETKTYKDNYHQSMYYFYKKKVFSCKCF